MNCPQHLYRQNRDAGSHAVTSHVGHGTRALSTQVAGHARKGRTSSDRSEATKSSSSQTLAPRACTSAIVLAVQPSTHSTASTLRKRGLPITRSLRSSTPQLGHCDALRTCVFTGCFHSLAPCARTSATAMAVQSSNSSTASTSAHQHFRNCGLPITQSLWRYTIAVESLQPQLDCV